jgi:hypothetical protein
MGAAELNHCVNAETKFFVRGSFSSPPMSTPMRRIRSGCCALAAHGHAVRAVTLVANNSAEPLD